MPDESPSLDYNYSHLFIFYIASLSYHLAFCFAVCVTHAGAVRSRILAEKIPKFLNRNTLSHTLPKKNQHSQAFWIINIIYSFKLYHKLFVFWVRRDRA
jgi:hypothetical protein